MLVNMLFLCVVTFVLFFFLVVRTSRGKCRSLPSPPGLPFIGNLHQLGSCPHRSLRALSLKYGPLMLLHIGRVPAVIVSSAEMAYEVMKTHDLTFSSRPRMSMAKMLLYDCDIAFSPYGEYWRQVRRVSVVHLLSNKMVHSFRRVREEEVSLMVGKIRSSQRHPVNLSELMVTLTNDIICRVALGRTYYGGEGVPKVRDMLRELLELLGSFPIGDFIPWLGWLDNLSGLNARVRKNSKELDNFLEGVLEEHLQARRDAGGDRMEDDDFVHTLLSLAQKDECVGISLGRDNIKALILDMFAAGTETTFVTLEWAMAELIKNPKIMKKVQEEVRGVVGQKLEIREKDIDEMIYLKSTIKETLRLHAPVPLLVPRETIEDVELRGFHIPMGTRVMVNDWAIGRDANSWDRSEEFLPERFVNSDIDFRGGNFQFIPFGAGRRSCPGIGFAVATIELALVHLLHNFDWEVPKGMEGEVLNMCESPGITAHKKSGLVLVAKPRAI